MVLPKFKQFINAHITDGEIDMAHSVFTYNIGYSDRFERMKIPWEKNARSKCWS